MVHGALDVIFKEDVTTLYEANSQLLLNILRKAVLNVLRVYRDKHEPKASTISITRKCLHDADVLLDVLEKFNNC